VVLISGVWVILIGGPTLAATTFPDHPLGVLTVIKLGLVDCDTSHCVEFTKRLNHQGIAEDQWVQGARVVVGCPGESKIAPELIPKYAQEMAGLGVRLVDRPEAMIGHVDGVLIESLEGAAHWERARPFLEAGIPCFIDKPFAGSVAEAKKIADLAARKGVPLFSSSSLRYAPEVVRFPQDPKHGRLWGVLAYGPASQHPRNPGLLHYAIHAVEILYTLMGPGCEWVTCMETKGTDVVTGRWHDGRLASIRGIRDGPGAFGFTAFTDAGVKSIPVSTLFIYRELLTKIVEMMQTRKPPLAIGVTVEIMAFMEAARVSAHNHGNGVRVEV
jgi:predicted dehydrogenase